MKLLVADENERRSLFICFIDSTWKQAHIAALQAAVQCQCIDLFNAIYTVLQIHDDPLFDTSTLQDSVGDTPLHDALNKGNADIINMLLATKKVNFNLQNAKGVNAVHQAALNGHFE